MNSMPPTPGPLPLPAPCLQVPDLPTPDPRTWGTAPDFAAMRALVAGLVVPGNASMYVMSALETSRELIRYSYYRYEFATVPSRIPCSPWSTSSPSVWGRTRRWGN
ncbi:hypothetical protein [Streptomyces erythrochromogenes]|uniref:hypothetical protein n=1 Tax=Streptomyces erythrochromogenes TaxID=285574 RepID=UPI00382848F7